MNCRDNLKRLLPFHRKLRRFWNRIRPLPPLMLQSYAGPVTPSPYASPVESENLLEQLGRKYEPTKCLHDYLKYYHLHFQGIRLQARSVLEIGVDSGKSIEMWEEYFPNAIIHGIDTDSRCKQFEGGRRKVHIGDGSAPLFLDRVLRQIPQGLDVVIDDGSHQMHHQIASFNYLLPRLNSHGIYAIEDTGASAGDYGLRVINRVATLVKGISAWPASMPSPWPPPSSEPSQNWMSHFPEVGHWADRNIVGISFYRWLAIVQRGINPGDNPYFHGK